MDIRFCTACAFAHGHIRVVIDDGDLYYEDTNMNNNPTNQWNAEAYARFSKGQKKWANELIAKLDITPNDSIIDIGCGDGKITAQLATITQGRVTGIDKDPNMIARATREYPNVEFRQMDATAMTFEAEYSIAFSNAALHWTHDHRAVLSGIRRALEPGGKVLLQFGGCGNVARVIEVVEKIIRTTKYQPYFQGFDFKWFFPCPDTYEKLLATSGLTDYRVQLIPKKMIHETLNDFRGWILTTWFPYINRVPHNLQETFIETIIHTYLNATDQTPNKPIAIDMARMEVSAHKPR
jgi:trans-aconitate methyltransferase